MARINQGRRVRVVEKFEATARQIFRAGHPRAKEAAAHLVGELGIEVRGVGTNWGGAMRPLTPELAALLKERDEPVRVAAAEALGKINPEADLAVPALSRALTTDSVPVRRAAAAAFADYIARATQLAKNQSAAGVLIYPLHVVDAALVSYIPVGSAPPSRLGPGRACDIVGEGRASRTSL